VTQSLGPDPDPDIRLVVVFRTSDVGLCALAKSVLESEGIEYAVRGEGLRDMFGWNAPGSLSNNVLEPAEFLVREVDAQGAIELLAKLRESDGSPSQTHVTNRDDA
jgi:hypothetical protein